MKLTVVAALLLYPALVQLNQTADNFIQIWTAGPMHPDEVLGQTGETWFGLFHSDEGFELLPATITVLDSPTVGGLYQKFVRTNRFTDPVFLIRGLPELREGAVKTVFFGYFRPTPSNGITLYASSDPMSQCNLHASGKQSTETIDDYKLSFSDLRTTQILATRTPAFTEAFPTLRWAGDLDRDGKLDLLIDMTNHYNIMLPTLFLSSRTAPTELLKEVASHRRGGC